MKRDLRTIVIVPIFAALALPGLVRAQTYEIPAGVIANGGGTVSAGSHSISGTVGQSALGTVGVAGSYALAGGFWEVEQQLLGQADIVAAPTATTNAATGIVLNGATLNGTVNPNGATTTVEFEWGLTPSYGNSVVADQSPLAAGTNNVAISKVLTGLAANTDYHYRVKATNGAGTTFGLDQVFKTQAVAGPSAPANVVMWGGSGAAAITWDPNPAGENVNHYTVYRNTIDNPATATDVQVVNLPYTHYVDHPGNTNSTEYWYWVTATDQSSQESPKSVGVSDWVDPPLAHQGGPDNFGYQWMDSQHFSGPPVDFYDITSSGTLMTLGDDTFSEVDLPFSYPFYDNNYTTIKISSNGYLAFGPEGLADLPANEDPGSETPLYIPSDSGANNFIAAFWADLNPDPGDGGGGTVHYYNDATRKRFIVQYTNVPLYVDPQLAPGKSGKDGTSVIPGDKFGKKGTGVVPGGKFGTLGTKNGEDLAASGLDPEVKRSPGKESIDMATDFTFQVQLYDDGAIMIQYKDMNGLTDEAVVGIENSAGDDGLAAVEWDFLVESNYAIGFFPPGAGGGFWIATLDANSITADSARLNAEVMPEGISTNVFFELWDETTPGTILEFTADQNPVSATEPIIVSAWATGLDTNTTYLFIAKASQGGGPTVRALNDQQFTTPISENEIVDVQTITDTGTVVFPSTGVTLDISAFTSGDLIQVAVIDETPTGEIPDTLELLITTSSWRFDNPGGDTFDLEITFELGADAIPQEYQDEPGRIKLLSRPTGSTGAWEIRTYASSATHHSVTFPNITYFSQFVIGAATPDILAPSISFAKPQVTQSGNDVTVTAQVTEDRGTPVVELIYLPGGGAIADTSIRTMVGGSPGEYSYTIPGSEIRFTGLLVRIKAIDGAGNDSVTAPVSVPVSYGADTLNTSTLPGMFTSTNGIPDSTWRLFSVPGYLDNSSLSLNIGDELGVESGEFTWKVFAYNSNTDIYAPSSNLLAGVGYWINQRIKSGLNFKLTAGQTKDLEGFNIELAPGWNLIGNPFPFAFPVQFNDSLFHGPITYDGKGWSESVLPNMIPWGGYAVYNRKATPQTLTLSTVPGPMLLAKTTEPGELAGWLMHLAARGEYYTDIANSIGRIQGASEELDRFDAPEPPFIDGDITLVMERPEWGGPLTTLSSDIRSWEETDGTWDLQLHTKGATGPIALSSRLEGNLPAGHKVVLMDLQQRAVYDLTAGEVPPAITDYSERYPYYLKVIAGSAAYVGQAVDDVLAQLPLDFALAQNYPNPFNPTTRLQYSLTRPAPVSLKIYNLLGQEITTLYEGWQDLGRFEAEWHGRDRFGNTVATGIYFAVFRAQGRMYTRKMLLLK